MRLFRVSTLAALVIAIVPIGQVMMAKLENRFPARPSLPQKVDGILILGGIIDPKASALRETPQIGGAIERITVGAELAHRYPDARVIFSGGSGDPMNPDLREAHYAPSLFQQFGLGENRVIFDDEARNTAENATKMLDIAKPASGDAWLLVTSAFHMPRAVGTFRKAGWKVIPYPVDFNTAKRDGIGLNLSLHGNLSRLGAAVHEYLGLLAYWGTGRSASLFPGPSS